MEFPKFSPIVLIAICYIGGIILVDFVRLSFWIPVVVLGLCLVFLVASPKYDFSFRPLLPYFAFLLLGFVLTSCVVYSLKQSILLKLAKRETNVVISGEVKSEPKTERERSNFAFEVEEVETQTKLYKISEVTRVVLEGREKSKKVRMGDKAKIEGVLSVPRNFSSSNQFDYKKYLYRKRIQTILTSTSKDLEATRKGNWFYRQLYFAREKIRKNAYRYLDRDRGGLLTAIVIGEKTGVKESVMNDFRDSGLAHVLVVSGLHVGLLAMTVWGLLKWLG